MATISERINSAYSTYMHTCRPEQLSAALGDLNDLLSDADAARYISAENRENAQYLAIKVQLKIYAYEYFCNGYENADFLTLKNYSEKSEQKCRELGFKKTGELCAHVLKCADGVDKIMFDAVALKMQVCDAEDKIVAKDADDCRRVKAAAEEKIAAAEKLDLPAIFSDGADFPDIGNQVVADLGALCRICEKGELSFSNEQAKAAMRTAVVDITERLNGKQYAYFPAPSTLEHLANAVVVCTPFAEEAEILAWSCAKGAKIYTMQALAFENAEKGGIGAVFAELEKNNADVIIYGMPRFRAKNKGEFLCAAMAYGKRGKRVYLVDDGGTRKIYDDAENLAKGEVTALDISFLYLSLPDFTQTVEEFQRLGMISDDGGEIDYIRKNMPFMGFAGLNEAVKVFSAGADWKSVARTISEDNFAAAEKYMLRLSRQGLLLDNGWGSYHEDITLQKAKKFDYDDIKSVNPDNVKRIMEGNFSLFTKCGMISTYCLLSGASAADWAGFAPELKAERLTEASKLVMRALGVDIVPVVEVLPEAGGKNAGGTCYDGGKRIVYKDSCVKDFDWTAKAVCHECFHAFQRHAITSGWQDWYETELHVTPGRIDQWSLNFGKYRNIDKDKDGYLIQIVESDARAFENDCFSHTSTGEILNLLDLE